MKRFWLMSPMLLLLIACGAQKYKRYDEMTPLYNYSYEVPQVLIGPATDFSEGERACIFGPYFGYCTTAPESDPEYKFWLMISNIKPTKLISI